MMLFKDRQHLKDLHKCLCEDSDEQFTKKDLIMMFEATMNEVKKSARSQTMQRSKGLKSRYIGMTKEGVLMFQTTSGTIKGKLYNQRVYLNDLPDVIQILEEDSKFTARDAILLAITTGNIKYHCDDPSYKYYFQYVATKKGSALREEKRFPRIRNPRLEGACCKHLLSVFRVLALNWNKIVRDARKHKLIPKRKSSKKIKQLLNRLKN